MIKIKIGYARVSTSAQNEDRQIVDLIKNGVPERNIYIDKQSGKNFDRPEYIKMMKRLKKDDVLVIKSIDPPRQKLQRDSRGMETNNATQGRRYRGA